MPRAKILYFVSDRAKGLIKLATVIHGVKSIADCFHFKYCINKLLCLALSSKLRHSKMELEKASQKGDIEAISRSSEKYAQIQFNVDLYVETMGNITGFLHPYSDGNNCNTSEQAQQNINNELAKIQQVVDNCNITDKNNLFGKAQNQVTDAVSVIGLWHDIKCEFVDEMQIPDKTKLWFEHLFLPKIYWEQAIQRTKHKPTIIRINKQLEKCKSITENEYIAKEIAALESERLRDFAVALCRKFQRASSQVEGRNGYLSLINHNQRGFDQNRLNVMTVVHNFDTRGIDRKTPAERLLGNKIEFENLFEFIVKNIGDLPRPRKSKLTG